MVETLVNTTVLSNLAAVDQLDLLRHLLGRIYISSEVYEELMNGLEEGYDFYAGIDSQIHPFVEDGWIRLVSMTEEDELRLLRSLPRRLHNAEASCLAGPFSPTIDWPVRQLARTVSSFRGRWVCWCKL